MAFAVKSISTLYGEEAREFRDRADEVEHCITAKALTEAQRITKRKV